MINYKKGSKISTIIEQERETIKTYNVSQLNMKKEIETYIKELDDITFNDQSFKIMLLNDFNNSIGQIDNNIQDLQSLNDILDILEAQEEFLSADILIYNKLLAKIEKNMSLVTNIIEKAIDRFDSVNVSDDNASIKFLKKMQKTLLGTISNITNSEIDSKKQKSEKTTSKRASKKSIQKVSDLTSSDLLCFFPKDESDNLVISTVQDSYKVSFVNSLATISIESDNFNMTLKTSGVQISNSKINNVLLVSYSESKYTILTNNQMEIPPFIQICKIAKKDDFIEVEIYADTLSLSIEDNIINFEETTSSTTEVKSPKKDDTKEQDEKDITEEPTSKIINDSAKSISEKVEVIEPSSKEETETTSKKSKKETEKKNNKEVEIKEAAKTATEPETITDNDTLIISDSNKNVILPYKVADLESKLKKNKKYKNLYDVIKTEYTIPVETFKNPIRSRFREAFQLIKKKEHGSLKEAISLGFELMFESDLNPAVIAACKNLDELDIYLDCLDDNELDKFSCFKISYLVPPDKKR